MQFLIFNVEERTFALDLSFIERVVWSAAMIPIPNEGVNKNCGMINIYGEIMPVVSMRDLLGLTKRAMELTDQFVVCRYKDQRLALWVEKVLEVREYNSTDLLPADHMFPASSCVNKVIKEKNNIIFVWNIKELYEEAKV